LGSATSAKGSNGSAPAIASWAGSRQAGAASSLGSRRRGPNQTSSPASWAGSEAGQSKVSASAPSPPWTLAPTPSGGASNRSTSGSSAPRAFQAWPAPSVGGRAGKADRGQASV